MQNTFYFIYLFVFYQHNTSPETNKQTKKKEPFLLSLQIFFFYKRFNSSTNSVNKIISGTQNWIQVAKHRNLEKHFFFLSLENYLVEEKQPGTGSQFVCRAEKKGKPSTTSYSQITSPKDACVTRFCFAEQ